MSKTADEVRGVTTQHGKNIKPVVIVPDAPERIKMTKAQAVEHQRKLSLAHEAAEKAKRAVMEAATSTPEEAESALVEDNTQSLLDEKLAELEEMKEALSDKQAELEENPEKRGVKASITRLEKKLDKAEKEVEDLQKSLQ